MIANGAERKACIIGRNGSQSAPIGSSGHPGSRTAEQLVTSGSQLANSERFEPAIDFSRATKIGMWMDKTRA
jgi:hypothetical protein